MTAIRAKVLAIDKQGDQYNVIVRIALAKYRHNGQLDLFYYRDPGLKAGKSFPLWTIQ